MQNPVSGMIYMQLENMVLKGFCMEKYTYLDDFQEVESGIGIGYRNRVSGSERMKGNGHDPSHLVKDKPFARAQDKPIGRN